MLYIVEPFGQKDSRVIDFSSKHVEKSEHCNLLCYENLQFDLLSITRNTFHDSFRHFVHNLLFLDIY